MPKSRKRTKAVRRQKTERRLSQGWPRRKYSRLRDMGQIHGEPMVSEALTKLLESRPGWFCMSEPEGDFWRYEPSLPMGWSYEDGLLQDDGTIILGSDVEAFFEATGPVFDDFEPEKRRSYDSVEELARDLEEIETWRFMVG